MQVTLSEEDARLIAKYVADELDIGQAAEYMNRSRSTIDRWRKTKPAFKVLEHIDGTSTYFLSNELDEYLNQ